MSDELERDSDLTKETVHGVKNVWQRFGSWEEESKPEPEPEPVQEPEPTPKPQEEIDGAKLQKMGAYVRKQNRMKITQNEAEAMILADPELMESLEKSGKF